MIKLLSIIEENIIQLPNSIINDFKSFLWKSLMNNLLYEVKYDYKDRFTSFAKNLEEKGYIPERFIKTKIRKITLPINIKELPISYQNRIKSFNKHFPTKNGKYTVAIYFIKDDDEYGSTIAFNQYQGKKISIIIPEIILNSNKWFHNGLNYILTQYKDYFQQFCKSFEHELIHTLQHLGLDTNKNNEYNSKEQKGKEYWDKYYSSPNEFMTHLNDLYNNIVQDIKDDFNGKISKEQLRKILTRFGVFHTYRNIDQNKLRNIITSIYKKLEKENYIIK